jgi:molecular chaperone GrpE
MSENYQEDNQNETLPAEETCGEEHTAVNETAEPTPAEQAPVENTPEEQRGSASTEQTADLTEEQGPEKRIAELEAKVAELNDQYLRKAAEFENFRKRINREKQDAIEFANQSLLLDVVQTMDDFERAIKSAETSKDFTSFYEGITMIEKRLSSQLENKWGLKRFDSEGQVFDPNQHEAIMREESAEVQEPMVKEEFIKGYTLKDRVIRSAKVKVLMPENS